MKKIYIYAFATALLWGSAGCNKLKDFGNVNVDPSVTSKPVISALLTNSEAQVAGLASTNNEPLSGGQYAQYFSETQYPSTSLYALPQYSFTGYYSGVLYDLQNIINLNQNKNTSAVAKILQQYIFWVITDTWGDVPYSQALQGIKYVTPKYDAQQDIYKGIFSSLTAAVAQLDGSTTITGDVIYNGDVASWKRAANSLKALAAIQLSRKVPGASDFAATAFKEAITSGVITDNSQNFAVNYPGGNYKSNWWNLYNGRKDYAESKTLTDLTGSYNDPRQAAFGGASEDPTVTTTSNVGVPYGRARLATTTFTDANPNWARVLRSDFRQQNGTVNIITAAEVYLARAEAASIGWTTESAQINYETGIRKSFEQWNVGSADAYLAQSKVTTATIQNIYIQEYFAAYPDGHMAWNIWRKTGAPGVVTLNPAPDATNASKLPPRRFVYSPTEYSTNAANVKAAAALIPGGDTQDSRVWWDQQ